MYVCYVGSNTCLYGEETRDVADGHETFSVSHWEAGRAHFGDPLAQLGALKLAMQRQISPP